MAKSKNIKGQSQIIETLTGITYEQEVKIISLLVSVSFEDFLIC
jgi:hypothetical protein